MYSGYEYFVWFMFVNNLTQSMACMLVFFLIFYLFIFREEGERKGGKHQCVVASHAFRTVDLACNPGTGNRTGNTLVHRPALSPLSHTSQGSVYFLNSI